MHFSWNKPIFKEPRPPWVIYVYIFGDILTTCGKPHRVGVESCPSSSRRKLEIQWKVSPFCSSFPPSVPAPFVGRAEGRSGMGISGVGKVGTTHVGALRAPCCSVCFPHFHSNRTWWNCDFFPSVHLQTGRVSTEMCFQRWSSGSRARRRNWKIYVLSPLYNRKEWKQLPKNAHRHLMKLFLWL